MTEIIKKTGEESNQVEADAGVPQLPSTSRRRLVQAGLAAAPVVLALSGRSAMAGNSGGTTSPTCLSEIAWVSANPKTGKIAASRTPRSSGDPGFTPVKWKPCEDGQTFPHVKWPSACKPFQTLYPPKSGIPASWDPRNCKTYSGFKYKNPSTAGRGPVDPGWNTGTKLTWLDSRSCSNLLIDEADAGTLKAHVCAAYLNALYAEEYGKKFPIKSSAVYICYRDGTLGGRKVSNDDLLAFFKQTCA